MNSNPDATSTNILTQSQKGATLRKNLGINDDTNYPKRFYEKGSKYFALY